MTKPMHTTSRTKLLVKRTKRNAGKGKPPGLSDLPLWQVKAHRDFVLSEKQRQRQRDFWKEIQPLQRRAARQISEIEEICHRYGFSRDEGFFAAARKLVSIGIK